jgi:glutathione S-transferase
MPEFRLVIGYRDTSTWSLRGWLAMKKTGAPFEEIMIRYRRPEDKARLRTISPTGKVPLLIHQRQGREVRVWDSLAIAEYLAELFPAKKLWPDDAVARAFARSASAEMHSGFKPLRENLSMDLLASRHGTPITPEARVDIDRVEAIWTEARETWGAKAGGPFLFGGYTIADAMYAPVCSRFRTYGVKLGPLSEAYVEAVLSDPDYLVWEDACRRDEPAEIIG